MTLTQLVGPSLLLAATATTVAVAAARLAERHDPGHTTA